MSWFKVDDGFHEHPKVHRLAERAERDFALCIAIWALSGPYAARHETDGAIGLATVRRLLPGVSREDIARAAGELVAVGLWELDGDGYRFHDWHDYQPTREAKEAKRRQERDKKARQRGVPRMSPGDTSGSGAGQATVSPRDAITCPPSPGPSRPVPTRPDPTPPKPDHARAPVTGRRRDPRVGPSEPDTEFTGGEVQL
jgi:hypothetical protein